MITAIVQFQLPAPVSLEEATRMFESTAPKYQNLPGLIRKYYLRSEDGRTAGGVYLWESKAAAEKVYSGEWRERVAKLYGNAPQVVLFRHAGRRRQSHRRRHHQGGIGGRRQRAGCFGMFLANTPSVMARATYCARQL